MYGSNFWSLTLYPCPSSRHPIDAAASPLPSEDTTPPVTKMNLVARPSVIDTPGRADPGVTRASTGGRRRQQAAHMFEVLRRVDFYRIECRFHCLDADAVLQCAQLFEPL